MRRIAKCSRCGELYRAVSDGHDSGACPLCLDSERTAAAQRDARRGRRRDLLLGVAAGLLVSGGLAGVFLSRGTEAVARTGGPNLEVHTDPVAVDVYLDEQWVGTTSLEGRLGVELPRGEPGGHWLEFRREGYQPQRRLLAMADLARPMSVLLGRSPMDARIETEPAGAAVWIAGEPQGLTPLTAKLAIESAGPIRLRVAKDGYESQEQLLPAPAPGQPLRFSAKLAAAAVREAPTAALHIETRPAGGVVWVNGRRIGTSPQRVALSGADLSRPVHVEGALGRTQFGAATVAPLAAGREETVTVELAFTARKVALAVDVTATAELPLAVVRERLKDEVQRLDPRQQFCIVAAAGMDRKRGEPGIVRSWDGWLAASSENKVRAYDFVDQLRPEGGESGTELLRAVAGMSADVAWFCMERPLPQGEWQRWFGPQGPAIEVVGGRDVLAEAWLKPWVESRRGTVEGLATAQTAQGPVADPDEAP